VKISEGNRARKLTYAALLFGVNSVITIVAWPIGEGITNATFLVEGTGPVALLAISLLLSIEVALTERICGAQAPLVQKVAIFSLGTLPIVIIFCYTLVKMYEQAPALSAVVGPLLISELAYMLLYIFVVKGGRESPTVLFLLSWFWFSLFATGLLLAVLLWGFSR
jgi:hypothetical protein